MALDANVYNEYFSCMPFGCDSTHSNVADFQARVLEESWEGM